VGLRAGLDAVVKRKISSPYRDSKPLIIQPVCQRYTTELTRLIFIRPYIAYVVRTASFKLTITGSHATLQIAYLPQHAFAGSMTICSLERFGKSPTDVLQFTEAAR
jgi:hypothetical protein